MRLDVARWGYHRGPAVRISLHLSGNSRSAYRNQQMTPYLFNLSHDPREFKPISKPLGGRESRDSNLRYDAHCEVFGCGSDLIFHRATQTTAQLKQQSLLFQLEVEIKAKNPL